MDGTLVRYYHSGPDSNEGLIYIPQSSSITGSSPSDHLVSYSGAWVLPFLQRCSRCILQHQPSGLTFNGMKLLSKPALVLNPEVFSSKLFGLPKLNNTVCLTIYNSLVGGEKRYIHSVPKGYSTKKKRKQHLDMACPLHFFTRINITPRAAENLILIHTLQ